MINTYGLGILRGRFSACSGLGTVLEGEKNM
jgi:hypothetical protein